MKNIFENFFGIFKNWEYRPKGNYQRTSLQAFSITLVVVSIGTFIYQYFALVPLNIRSPKCIVSLIVICAIFGMLYTVLRGSFDKVTKSIITLGCVLALYLGVGMIISLPIFHASAYQQQLPVDKNADFFDDNEKVSYESIPVVDKDSATRLGDRKMGEIVEYVSQFDVDESYEQINYKNRPYRVTPLEYSGLVKWFTNHKNGLPAYISVDMVTQDAEVVELKEGMKYSKAEYFGRNIERHVQFNYPTYMFDNIVFEIDDDGTPYWIASRYDYQIGFFGGKDIVGAVLVNAINGDHKYYNIKEVPKWVDRIYSSDLVHEQLQNWGKYENGFFNTLFSQKGVLQPTEGYNYIAMNDDVYYYTGLTSVSKDASNVGFMFINMRTKESKYYAISGAEEYSAMSSAEGQVQHLKYKATIPILVNIANEPTYFLSLKDDAELVKQYAFVSVENYQIVATADSVAKAEAEYYKLLVDNGKIKEEEVVKEKDETLTGVITEKKEVVQDGNTMYYFKLDSSDLVFVADISLSYKLPFTTTGDTITVTYPKSKKGSVIVTKITFE